MEIMKISNLRKTYGSGNTSVEALKSTNLSFEKGEFAAIIGPSGSGKSTLLHLLGGLDRPTDGSVSLEGENIYALPDKELSILRRRKFGFIFQSYNLIPVLSAEENIMFPALLDKKSVDKNYSEDLLAVLGLQERRKHFPNELSGGQQQRVSIARALINKPAIIFADEPTGNLDIKTSDEVMKLLKFFVKKYDQTLVMITHDHKIAKSADRIISIEDGVIIEDKTNNG